MNDTDISVVIQTLEKISKNWENPPVEKINSPMRDPFKVLISCILSLRTKDEVTRKASERLFSVADNIEKLSKLSISQIEKLIYPVGFYRNKAKIIKKICEILTKKYVGKVPSSLDELLSLPGVGRKTANLVITIGFGKPGICVDTHVHRITNRWGYLTTTNPSETESVLRKKLPRPYWIKINSLLVKFGQNICRPVSPLCSRCPIERFCEKIGVTRSR